MNSEDNENVKDSLHQKLLDIMTPGVVAELTPEEAELFDGCEEDAMSEKDALESAEEIICVNGEYYAK